MRGARGEGEKRQAASASTRSVILFSWERKERWAFLKFMLADVPSAYACIRILCGCNEGSVRSMPKKNSRGTIALKRRNASASS